MKMFKQVRVPPAHVKERAYPKTVTQGGGVERYGELNFRIDETIFVAFDKAELRKAKILVISSSNFVHTSMSLFWPDVIMLAKTDLDWMQSLSMANLDQRKTEMNPITIVFAGIDDYLHSRGLLSREPRTMENVVWLAITDILESMGEVMVVLEESGFQNKTPKPVFVLSAGYAHLPGGLKFVYAKKALLFEGKIDVFIPVTNPKVEARNLMPLWSELRAVWSDISNVVR